MLNPSGEIRILELFSGYGTATFALKKLGLKHKVVAYSDIDKYANQCFKQNHCPDDKENKLRLGDIKQIEPTKLPDFNLLTGGFPCQSFSIAGKGLGEADPRGTLFYEIIRIAEIKQPEYMLLENVKGLTTKRFKETFDKIISELRRINYNVYWKVLNSKDFGIPQNRERVWFVCIRKDIDEPFKFQFPQERKLKIFIKDILEPEVYKKYYLTETQINKILYSKFNAEKKRIQKNISSTILSRDYKDPKCVDIADYRNDEGLRIRKGGISPCLAKSKCSKFNI
jgi:DNA (cytosine-5)-methyltransferase 1